MIISFFFFFSFSFSLVQSENSITVLCAGLEAFLVLCRFCGPDFQISDFRQLLSWFYDPCTDFKILLYNFQVNQFSAGVFQPTVPKLPVHCRYTLQFKISWHKGRRTQLLLQQKSRMPLAGMVYFCLILYGLELSNWTFVSDGANMFISLQWAVSDVVPFRRQP